MTQIRKVLFNRTSHIYVEMNSTSNVPSRDLKPSPELFEMIQAAASSLTGFAQLWESIRKKGNNEGFTDLQLQWLLRPLLKDKLKMSNDKIYYLFHREEKAEQNKKAYHERLGLIRQIDEKKELEESSTVPVTSAVSNKALEPAQEINMKDPSIEDQNEEPTELELAEIRIAQLEDALRKTQMFKPATQLQEQQQQQQQTIPPLQEEEVFTWLGKRDNKITCFYYGSCSTGFIKANILKNLENSGIKVFKRLYFEV
jgi:hypothetical protein